MTSLLCKYHSNSPCLLKTPSTHVNVVYVKHICERDYLVTFNLDAYIPSLYKRYKIFFTDKNTYIFELNSRRGNGFVLRSRSDVMPLGKLNIYYL